MADNSKDKHTQIVQVLLPAPEPKKTTRRRRRVARPVAEAVPTAEPAPYNGYTPIYPSFTPGMPSFSPSIDITTGGQYPPYEPPAEPPAGMATIPPIEAEAETKPTKKKSKLKGIIKAVGRGVATALEAIGEKPTTGGITPVMPEPIPVDLTAPSRVEEPDDRLPSFIPPYPMPSYQMYRPSPFLLTGEPMTQEAETQTAPEVIYAPAPTRETAIQTLTSRERTREKQAEFLKNLTQEQKRLYSVYNTKSKLKAELLRNNVDLDTLQGLSRNDLFKGLLEVLGE